MSYLPYRLLDSWTCLRCGKCCREYQVPLPPKERERIEARYPEAVVARGGEPYLAKTPAGCVFQFGDGCLLHDTELKPYWCRLWPFCVSPHRLERYEDVRAEATFFHQGRDYFVYVQTECPGVNRGSPAEFRAAIIAAIELCTAGRRGSGENPNLWIPGQAE